MASKQAEGILQADGRVAAEATFDPKHVADAVVHIAGLPLDVTILNFTIMYAMDLFVAFHHADVMQGNWNALCWPRLNMRYLPNTSGKSL